MTTFWTEMLRGMGAAGWAIGFIAALGIFLILAGVLVLGIIAIADALDRREGGTNDEPAGDPDVDARAAGMAGRGRAFHR